MIGVGSFVNFAGAYTVAEVQEDVTPIGSPDKVWRCVQWGGVAPVTYAVHEIDLYELTFSVFPAGFAAGDVVEVADDGKFWAIPQGAGVRIGRGMLLYPMLATLPGPITFPVAWVQLEDGRPSCLAFYESLTIVRKFGAPVP